MENIDLYLNNSSAFIINAGSGGGNPYHDENGRFAEGPSSVCKDPISKQEASNYLKSQKLDVGNKNPSFKEGFANSHKGRIDDSQRLKKIGNFEISYSYETGGNKIPASAKKYAEVITKLSSSLEKSSSKFNELSKIARENNKTDGKVAKKIEALEKEYSISKKETDSLFKLATKSKNVDMEDYINEVKQIQSRFKAQDNTLKYLMNNLEKYS